MNGGLGAGCFGVPPEPAISSRFAAAIQENQQNCINGQDCLIAASFEYCDLIYYNKQNGKTKTLCKKFGQIGHRSNVQNTGTAARIRIKMAVDTRYFK